MRRQEAMQQQQFDLQRQQIEQGQQRIDLARAAAQPPSINEQIGKAFQKGVQRTRELQHESSLIRLRGEESRKTKAAPFGPKPDQVKPVDETKELKNVLSMQESVVNLDRLGPISTSEWAQFLGTGENFVRDIVDTQRDSVRRGDQMSPEQSAIENAAAGLVNNLLALSPDGRPLPSAGETGMDLISLQIDPDTADRTSIGTGATINGLLGSDVKAFQDNQQVTFTDLAMAVVSLAGNPSDADALFRDVIEGALGQFIEPVRAKRLAAEQQERLMLRQAAPPQPLLKF
jgi:hypothetical protein